MLAQTVLASAKRAYWTACNPQPILRRVLYPWRRRHHVIVRNGYRYRLHAHQEFASQSLYVEGTCAKFVTTLMTAALPHVASVIDVGANLGCVTIPLAAQFDGPLLSIEPARDTFALLEENLRLNGLTHVHAVRVAVSDAPGRLTLSHSPTNSGDHRLAVGTSERRAGAEMVDVVTLDSLAADFPSPCLIKIDVQGHEGHVLNGARHLLGQPAILVMEFWPHGLALAGSSVSDLTDLLTEFGLTSYAVATDRLALERRDLPAIAARLAMPHDPEATCDVVLTNLPLDQTGLRSFVPEPHVGSDPKF